MTWKTKFGASQQAAVKLTTIDPKSPSQGVLLKVQAGSIATAGAISVVYDATAKAVRVSTLRLGTAGLDAIWQQAGHVRRRRRPRRQGNDQW